MKSIILIMPYFGKWPPWFEIYLASCKKNPTINWHFFTDCPIPESVPSNVGFTSTTFDEYKQRVRDRLRISFDTETPYKICDLRPAFGIIHEEDIAGFDYFGWGDVDLIYGNIRKFYTEDVLTHHVISNVDWGISGHLALIKNEEWLRKAFYKIPDWKIKFSDPRHLAIDEIPFGNVFLPNKNSVFKLIDHILKNEYKRNNYFKEQYTTPFSTTPWYDGFKNDPEIWYWKDGRVTNDRNDDQEFIYLHFMNYISARWMMPKYGKQAPWQGLPKVVHVEASQIDQGLRIDRLGFHPYA